MPVENEGLRGGTGECRCVREEREVETPKSKSKRISCSPGFGQSPSPGLGATPHSSPFGPIGASDIHQTRYRESMKFSEED